MNPVALNPLLRSSLEKTCGEVRILNPGLAMIPGYVKSPVKPRYTPAARSRSYLGVRERLVPQYWGETYVTCCPVCHDTRFRLYVSYLFGVLDKHLRSRNLHLAYCFNENCFEKFETQEELYRTLYEPSFGCRRCLDSGWVSAGPAAPGKRKKCPSCHGNSKSRPLNVGQGKRLSPDELKVALPGFLYPLTQMEDDSDAIRYLLSRGFDPEILWKRFKVQFCVHDSNYLISGRIIIPMYLKAELVGFQARYPGELDWKGANKGIPKYYTCPGMKKSLTLYNYDVARRYRTGVVLEGVTDVWALGSMGMGQLGKSLSPRQQELLCTAFSKHNLVLVPDANEDKKGYEKTMALANRAAEHLREHIRKGVAIVPPPQGCDPGELEQKVLRRWVRNKAAEQGVEVSYDKRE